MKKREMSREIDVFAAVAHPIRRQILLILRSGPRTASDLAHDMPIGRPAVSEHLQVLRTAKLALVERRGREWHYYLDPRPLTDIGSWLNGILVHWTRRVDDLEAVARRGRKVT